MTDRTYDRFLVIFARSDVASGNPAARATTFDLFAERQCVLSVLGGIADEDVARNSFSYVSACFQLIHRVPSQRAVSDELKGVRN